MKEQRAADPAFYRYLPFAVFMAFVGLDECIRFLAEHGLVVLQDTTLYYLYPVKTMAVAFLLFAFRRHYHELTFSKSENFTLYLAIAGIGLLVFLLWIQMDWAFGVTGPPKGFNPTLLPEEQVKIMTMFRVVGAVLVVPIMEELFWRSFLIRYIIDKDFENVPIGAFSWASFFVTTLMFGFEHNFILAGIMAGVVYNLILYKTRSIAQCVLAHAVTNLALALYVIATGKWHFW